ncbi:MAG: hypothetical protein RBT80_05075 [Candidatus Vecturithrix sp.]|jgi:hypothetical protein|nr:hypothetical protein [Candidatus Vecturithrix sp.]
METEKKLPWLLRIMYMLPILLCVTITVVTVIASTRTSYTVPVAIIESDLQEESERGEEILKEQQAQNERES